IDETGQRLEHDIIAITEHRDPPARVHTQHLRRLVFLLGELQQARLVRHALVLERQQHPPRKRAAAAPEDFKCHAGSRLAHRAVRAAPGLYWRAAVGGTIRGRDTRPAAMSTTSSPLISAEALAERLGEPTLRLFDCRFDLADPGAGERDYALAHLPGAVHVHLGRDLFAAVTPDTPRHPLPSACD